MTALMSSVSSFSLETAFEIPRWWNKLPQPRKDKYLTMHPRSKYHKVAKAEIANRLKERPKERVKLRATLKKIAASVPDSIKSTINKFTNFDTSKVSKKDAEDIKNSVKEAGQKGKSKAILKGLVTALAVAGALTVGGALLASGGLPYAIITARLVQDTAQLTRDVYHRVKQGESVVKAMFSSAGPIIAKSLTDPKMIAAALMLKMQNKKADEKEEETEKTKPNKNKKDTKVQKPSVKPKVTK